MQRPGDTFIGGSLATVLDMRRRSAKPDIRRAVISAAAGLAAYYLTRIAGGTQLDAMLVATGVTAARVAYAAFKSRSLDLVACYMMLMHAAKIAIAVATQSARTAMLAGHVGAMLFVVFMVASCAAGRPLTAVMIDALRPGWAEKHVAQNGWTNKDLGAYHRLHLHLTLFVALVRLAQLVAAIIIICRLSPDTSQPILVVLNIPVKVFTAVVVVAALGRFLRSRNRTPALQPEWRDAENQSAAPEGRPTPEGLSPQCVTSAPRSPATSVGS